MDYTWNHFYNNFRIWDDGFSGVMLAKQHKDKGLCKSQILWHTLMKPGQGRGATKRFQDPWPLCVAEIRTFVFFKVKMQKLFSKDTLSLLSVLHTYPHNQKHLYTFTHKNTLHTYIQCTYITHRHPGAHTYIHTHF